MRTKSVKNKSVKSKRTKPVGNQGQMMNPYSALFPDDPIRQVAARLMFTPGMSANSTLSRRTLARYLGKTYDDERDLYEVLGYPTTLNFSHYDAMYDRNEVASRIVEAYPNACWRLLPTLSDGDEGEETSFKEDVNRLVKEKHLWHYLFKADVLSCLGRYAVILLGIRGQEDPENMRMDVPLEQFNGDPELDNILYMRPFSEDYVSVQEVDRDLSSPNYGKPLIYKISSSFDSKSNKVDATSYQTIDLQVHWSRVIHLAEHAISNDIYGLPKLKRVYNRLLDLDKVAGGAGEMFWRGAFPGYNFKLDPDVDKSTIDADSINEEMNTYIHSLRRYVKMQGISVEELQQQVANPENHYNIILSLISIGSAIPKRILEGSERGELASSQDEKNWASRVEVRRTSHLEPFVIRPMIDRFIEHGLIAEPKDGEYSVEWPSLFSLSDKDRADFAKKVLEGLAIYTKSPGLDLILPPSYALSKLYDMDQEELSTIEDMIKDLIDLVEEEEVVEPLEDEGEQE